MMIVNEVLNQAQGVYMSWIGSTVINGFQDLVTMRDVSAVCNAGKNWGDDTGFGEIRAYPSGNVYGRLRKVANVTAPDDAMGILKAGLGWGLPLKFDYTPEAQLTFKVRCQDKEPQIAWWIRQVVEIRGNGTSAFVHGQLLDSGIITRWRVVCACCKHSKKR